jgi:hypothetical protein
MSLAHAKKGDLLSKNGRGKIIVTRIDDFVILVDALNDTQFSFNILKNLEIDGWSLTQKNLTGALANAHKGDILIDSTHKSEYEVLAVLDNLLFIRYLSGVIDCAPTFNTLEILEANGYTIKQPQPEECKFEKEGTYYRCKIHNSFSCYDQTKHAYNIDATLIKEREIEPSFPEPVKLKELSDKEIASGKPGQVMIDNKWVYQPKLGKVYSLENKENNQFYKRALLFNDKEIQPDGRYYTFLALDDEKATTHSFHQATFSLYNIITEHPDQRPYRV